MNNLNMVQITYSTADFEKTLSTDNDPAIFICNTPSVNLPSGKYRVVAGKIVRVQDGLPGTENSHDIKQTKEA